MLGLYRRGARRWRKIYQFNGHSFVARRFGKVKFIHVVTSLHVWILIVELYTLDILNIGMILVAYTKLSNWGEFGFTIYKKQCSGRKLFDVGFV